MRLWDEKPSERQTGQSLRRNTTVSECVSIPKRRALQAMAGMRASCQLHRLLMVGTTQFQPNRSSSE